MGRRDLTTHLGLGHVLGRVIHPGLEQVDLSEDHLVVQLSQLFQEGFDEL